MFPTASYRAKFTFLLLLAGLMASGAQAQSVPDDRDASFMPPPASEMAVPSTNSAPAAVAPSAAATPPAATASPVAAPVEIAQPVATETLAPVDPDTIGLLSANNGGLGAAMWSETPRVLVERLLPTLNLPTPSPTLNNLARRLLLSAAALPKGDTTLNRSFTALRIEKLMALGDINGAWQLALQSKSDRVDDATMRTLTEAALIGPDNKAVCDKLAAFMSDRKDGEWQKAQIVCQLRSGDMKGAQLGLDLMREQQVRDDIFTSIVNRNILGGLPQLPRQLTPLRPLTLAVLRQANLPLPPELYRKPDATMVTEILAAKAADENARLGLAERMAARGLISASQLSTIYRDVTVTPDVLNNALNSAETGSHLRAILYQAAFQEKDPQKKISLITRLVQSFEAPDLHGTAGPMVADLVNDITVATDYNNFAPLAITLYALAGKPDQAMSWLKLARGPASRLPVVAAAMDGIWPTLVLSGLISDTEYNPGMKSWLDTMLKELPPPATPASSAAEQAAKTAKDQNNVMQKRRQQAGSVMLLFAAAGYAIPEEVWGRVVDVSQDTKRAVMPSAIFLDRLRDAGDYNRKGETVLLCLSMAGNDMPPLFAIVEAVKSLRKVGLVSDAQALARETATALLSAPVTP